MVYDKKNTYDYILVQKFLETKNRIYFERLYNHYTNIVFRKCLSYLKNKEDAEDTAQEIWVKVFFALSKFEQKSTFSTWLYRITANQCVNNLKKRKIFVSLDLLSEKGFDVKDEKEDILTTISNNHLVTETLSLLSKDMRALLLMKYADEYTYADIACATGLGESAVKMRIARAKEQLQEVFSNTISQ
jgi:RNA polymerase sigma factor (sigma-70 family)